MPPPTDPRPSPAPATRTPGPGPAREPRERILEAAMALFAARGYKATTVRAIEEAAGFSPGAGGLYRHFGSKADILAAAIRRHEADLDADVAALPVEALDELAALPARDALVAVAHVALDRLARQGDLMAVLFRDLDDFPDLRREFLERQVQRTYATFAGWIGAERARRGHAPADADALAAVALGALVNYRLIEALLGEAPARVPEDRFVEAWADLMAPAIDP